MGLWLVMPLREGKEDTDALFTVADKDNIHVQGTEIIVFTVADQGTNKCWRAQKLGVKMNFKGHAKDLCKSLSFMTCDNRAYGFWAGAYMLNRSILSG